MSDCKPVLTPMEPGLRLSSSMSPNSPQEVLAMKGVPYVSLEVKHLARLSLLKSLWLLHEDFLFKISINKCMGDVK